MSLLKRFQAWWERIDSDKKPIKNTEEETPQIEPSLAPTPQNIGNNPVYQVKPTFICMTGVANVSGICGFWPVHNEESQEKELREKIAKLKKYSLTAEKIRDNV